MRDGDKDGLWKVVEDGLRYVCSRNDVIFSTSHTPNVKSWNHFRASALAFSSSPWVTRRWRGYQAYEKYGNPARRGENEARFNCQRSLLLPCESPSYPNVVWSTF